MKNHALITFLVISLTLGFSCNSTKTVIKNSVVDMKPDPIDLSGDYSKSTYEAISLVRDDINSEKFEEMKIVITSIHNGTYSQISKLSKRDEKITIETTRNNVNGEVSKNVKTYELKKFNKILDELLIQSEIEIVIAGTYQNIIIENSKLRKTFKTRKALGIMNIL